MSTLTDDSLLVSGLGHIWGDGRAAATSVGGDGRSCLVHRSVHRNAVERAVERFLGPYLRRICEPEPAVHGGQTAVVLQVSEDTIARLVRRVLHRVPHVGGKVLIPRTAVDELLTGVPRDAEAQLRPHEQRQSAPLSIWSIRRAALAVRTRNEVAIRAQDVALRTTELFSDTETATPAMSIWLAAGRRSQPRWLHSRLGGVAPPGM